MSQSDDPNAEQREFWRAAAVWVDQQERLDAQLAHIGVAAMDAVDRLPSAARVLDVGCGCGQTSLQWSERVSGSVLGVDISEPLVEVARRRAAEHSAAYPEAAPISFAVADAQTADIAGLATESAADNGSFAGFDVVFSRLGVMFFADPVAAFVNLRSATRPGGQLSFVCWQRARNNPWLVSVNKAVLGIVEMPSSDGPAVDPFAFADPDHVQGILGAAGWSDIAIEPHDTELVFSGGGHPRRDRRLRDGPRNCPSRPGRTSARGSRPGPRRRHCCVGTTGNPRWSRLSGGHLDRYRPQLTPD
ncbi:class I SAM-dependent methyltransferase [Candidatus Poriferisodalis sp.]|uniref:class I SAM-dependent methyltransferase n=1 Tax=Candidatus Poriferisodalis sp. TaxID=3101277 RepID=UPI003B52C2B9